MVGGNLTMYSIASLYMEYIKHIDLPTIACSFDGAIPSEKNTKFVVEFTNLQILDVIFAL